MFRVEDEPNFVELMDTLKEAYHCRIGKAHLKVVERRVEEEDCGGNRCEELCGV